MPRIHVLPSQKDIYKFRTGCRPENVLTYDFGTQAEVDAYTQGISVIEDAFDELDGLNVVGAKVTFTRPTDEESDADIQELVFATVAEAEACRQGIDDSEGFSSPLVIEADTDEFAALEALINEAGFPHFVAALQKELAPVKSMCCCTGRRSKERCATWCTGKAAPTRAHCTTPATSSPCCWQLSERKYRPSAMFGNSAFDVMPMQHPHPRRVRGFSFPRPLNARPCAPAENLVVPRNTAIKAGEMAGAAVEGRE